MVGQMPDGRRAVKVVMLNGHSTLFIVEVFNSLITINLKSFSL